MSDAAAPLADLRDLPRGALRAFVTALGAPAFRGDQVFRWIWKRGATSFDEMTDLPADLRTELARTATLGRVEAARIDVSADGTRKFLVRLRDGLEVESVLIPEADRMTLCVSSQVGCALGCAFCATGTMGLRRNLTAGEIAGQVALAIDELRARPHEGHPDRERPVTNLVYMGMGEPLHNYDATVASLRILTDEQGLAFPPRRITVSTVGLVPQMQALAAAAEEIPVNLAVSLHAPNDAVRGRLLPVNRRFGFADVIAACRAFPLGTRRRITFEYVLLAGVNDRPEHADELARALRGLRCKVNLIPWNEHRAGESRRPMREGPRAVGDGGRTGLPSRADSPESEARDVPLRRPSDAAVLAFEARLRDADVPVTVRTPRGRDIAAACGQLALESPGRAPAAAD